MTYSNRIHRAQQAVEEELTSFTDDAIRNMPGYIAESIIWRLINDNHIEDGIPGEP